MSEITDGFDVSTSSAKSVENFSDTGTLLHRNDSELILLVNPHQECLGIVVENTSAIWPVSVEVACSQESVSLSILFKQNLELELKLIKKFVIM